jgi:hypothetical protein
MGDYANDVLRDITRFKPRRITIPTIICSECGDVINNKTYNDIKGTCCERSCDKKEKPNE